MADVVASQVSVRELKTHLSEWLARAQDRTITAMKSAVSASTSPMQKGTLEALLPPDPLHSPVDQPPELLLLDRRHRHGPAVGNPESILQNRDGSAASFRAQKFSVAPEGAPHAATSSYFFAEA